MWHLCGTGGITQDPKNPQTLIKTGAGRRIRTDDRLITNQVLYQLSYAGDWRNHTLTKRPLGQARPQGDWETNVHEFRPVEIRIRQSTRIRSIAHVREEESGQ